MVTHKGIVLVPSLIAETASSEGDDKGILRFHWVKDKVGHEFEKRRGKVDICERINK